MKCTACGSENAKAAKFCNQCAGPLPLVCLRCGVSNPLGSKFCNECAEPSTLSSTSRPDTHASSEVKITPGESDATPVSDGERKAVTALFADIKGSTELMAELDPEEARGIIDPALKLMIEAVHRYDGYVVQSTGDGIFALFGAPVAHEDHPQRALFAALRLQDAIHRYSARLVADGCTPLEARVGINTGEVVVLTLTTADGRAEYTPIG